MSPTFQPAPTVPAVRPRLRPALQVLGGTVTVAVALVAFAAPDAGAAAAPKPNAQSVGNFLDATLGGAPLDRVAALKYARATAPGATSTQNPLDATVLDSVHLPLTGALQLPSLLGIRLGAVNQVAVAKKDGYSYGAAGAVRNSGGVSIGGDNAAFPADARIELTASGLGGNAVALPGGGNAYALGGVTLTTGAVSALAQTPAGYGKAGTTAYQIAGLQLELGSPALGALLGDVLSSTTKVLQQVATAAGAATSKLTGCDLTSGAVPSRISLENGAVVINPAAATITVSLAKLLAVLGLDLNALPANTDALSYLLGYLADPNGLAKGIQGVIDGLVDPLVARYEQCAGVLDALGPLDAPLKTLLATLVGGKQTLENSVSALVGSLTGAAGANPLAPIATLLDRLLDIGINVQPNGPAGPKGAAFTDPLAATPKQGTAVVPGQTIVRALELTVAAGAGRGGLLTLALANAAAGPSAATPSVARSHGVDAATAGPAAAPTAVPAGLGAHGSPTAPIVLLIAGLVLAGGGLVTWRVRGRRVL
jgi:hypothetical protein